MYLDRKFFNVDLYVNTKKKKNNKTLSGYGFKNFFEIRHFVFGTYLKKRATTMTNFRAKKGPTILEDASFANLIRFEISSSPNAFNFHSRKYFPKRRYIINENKIYYNILK